MSTDFPGSHRDLLEPHDDYAFVKRVGAKYGADFSEHDGPTTSASS